MSAALGGLLLALRREQVSKQSFGHISDMGLFPSQLSPVFPISKGRLLSFIRTEARSKIIIPFNGAFCLRHDERGEKEHPSTSVPASLKGCSLRDNKSYETTQAAENR